MPLVAIDGCTIQDTAGQGQVQIIPAGMSKFSKVDGKAICLDGLQVTVSDGTVPGPQVEPVTVTINAMNILGTKIEGKNPLAVGDMSDGTAMGKYTVGQSVVSAPIIVMIVDAGQTDVQMS